MTDRLLLDTHIALWLDSGDDALRPPTRASIDDCVGRTADGRQYRFTADS
ncbi:MAG TPA: hypothetical protein VHT00_21485 [Stellaceae bacterium]|nr:hypothetical protein [Stellaceae bacterium]